MSQCRYPGCTSEKSKKAGRGLCRPHYAQVQHSGTLNLWPRSNLDRTVQPVTFPLCAADAARFMSKVVHSVESSDKCWHWIAHKQQSGYGVFRLDRLHMAHRVAYMHFVGPIADGYEVDHLCRIRDCVNPEHLEAVPARVNILRSLNPPAINARRLSCKRGHPYLPKEQGAKQRLCMICMHTPWTCADCGVTTKWKNKAQHIRRVHRRVAA